MKFDATFFDDTFRRFWYLFEDKVVRWTIYTELRTVIYNRYVFADRTDYYYTLCQIHNQWESK